MNSKIMLTAAGGVAAACAAVALTVTASSNDGAQNMATSQYLHARFVLERRIAAHEVTGDNESRQWASHIMSLCPTRMAGQDNTLAAQLRLEIINGVAGQAQKGDHEAIIAFGHEVAGLRWSDPRIAGLIRVTVAQEQYATSGLQPDVCDDVRFWRASGYRRLSAASLRFLAGGRAAPSPLARQLKAAGMSEVNAGHAILELLLGHAGVRQKQSIRRLMKYEERLLYNGLLHKALITERNIARVLGVGQHVA